MREIDHLWTNLWGVLQRLRPRIPEDGVTDGIWVVEGSLAVVDARFVTALFVANRVERIDRGRREGKIQVAKGHQI